MSIISSSGMNGLYLASPIVGIFVDRIRHPKTFLLIGSFCFLVGYTQMGLLYSWNDSSLYGLMAFFYFLVGIGTSSSFHSSMATNYRNFPSNERGRAVGIPVACFGLSAFLYTMICQSIFFQNQSFNVLYVLLFMGISCGLLTMIAGFFLKPISSLNPEIVNEISDFPSEISSNHPHDTSLLHSWNDESINAPTTRINENRLDSDGSFTHSVIQRQLEHEQQEEQEDDSYFSSQLDSNQPSSLSILKDMDAYLVGISLLCIVGVGLMYINNVGTIAVSLLSDSKEAQKYQGFQVALLSVSNFLGRIGSGVASDYFKSID